MESPTWFIGAAAIIAALTAGWDYIKGIVMRLRALFVVKVDLDTKGKAMLNHYFNAGGFTRSRICDRAFTSAQAFLVPKGKMNEILLEKVPSTPVAYRRKGSIWPMFFKHNDEGFNAHSSELVAIRGTVNVDNLLRDAERHYNESVVGSHCLDPDQYGDLHASSRFQLHRFVGKGSIHRAMIMGKEQDSGGPARYETAMDKIMDGSIPLNWKGGDIGISGSGTGKIMDLLYFPDEVWEIVNAARKWHASEDWYKRSGVLWRFGVFLSGLPGTGKSSLAKAIAQELDMPLCVMDIASMNNEELLGFWGEAVAKSPCVILIEDIDAVFDGRENCLGEQGGGLSFDCLINCISGVETSEGVMLVVTTNSGSKVDSALTRPGRLDMRVDLGTMDRTCRSNMAKRIVGELLPKMEVELLIDRYDEATPSEFQEACVRVALDLFWNDSDTTKIADREAA